VKETCSHGFFPQLLLNSRSLFSKLSNQDSTPDSLRSSFRLPLCPSRWYVALLLSVCNRPKTHDSLLIFLNGCSSPTLQKEFRLSQLSPSPQHLQLEKPRASPLIIDSMDPSLPIPDVLLLRHRDRRRPAPSPLLRPPQIASLSPFRSGFLALQRSFSALA